MKWDLLILPTVTFAVLVTGCSNKQGSQKIQFTTLTNGTVLQGAVELPLEMRLKSFDGIFLTANGGPVSGSATRIYSNSAGQWFLDWNTQDYPNGIYDIYLEADSGDESDFSATNTVVVSNMISFDPFPIYGEQMWIHARLAVQRANWKVKVFDEMKYVGHFEGTTTNGFISFIWKFEDVNGKTLASSHFTTEVSATPSADCQPEIPTNHPDPRLVIASFPLDDKTPHKLIPAADGEK